MKVFWISVFLLCALAAAQEQSPPRFPGEPELWRKRAEWFYEQRAYPLGFIPANLRLKALRELDRMAEDEKRRVRAFSGERGVGISSSQWTSIGPRPTNSPPNVIPRLVSGWVSALAADSRNANVAYLGGAEGGVWKTTDGGLNWTPLTDTQPSLSIGSLALDPSNPDILYVGTGALGSGTYGAGILKSLDGGATWTNLPGPFVGPFGPNTFFDGGVRILGLAVHPSSSSVLLAAVWRWPHSEAGIFRSTDAGVKWAKVLSGAAGSQVVFDPTNGSIAYAGVGDFYGSTLDGFYKSTDAGLTWRPANGTGSNALPTANVGNVVVAIARSNPAVLYVGLNQSGTGKPLGFFKSVDGALNWSPVSATCLEDRDIRLIAVHPSDANVVVFGDVDLHRSLDGGTSCANITSDLTRGANSSGIHGDMRSAVFSWDGSKLYVGDDGGAWSTPDATRALFNWTNLNATLALTQFYPGFSIDPATPNRSFAGSQDNGVQRYGGGPAWDHVLSCDGGWTAIDPTTPATVYANCQGIQVFKSASNGDFNGWVPAQNGINTGDRASFIPPLVMDPSRPPTLYFGTYRIYQTHDGAGSWAAISPDLTRGSSYVTTVAVAPSDSNTVYAGTQDGKVQVTRNAVAGTGASWTDRSSGLPNRAVTQITVDPGAPAAAYVTLSGFSGFSGDLKGHVFKTTDGGSRWADISGNLPNIPMNDIVIDPDLPGTLYVATDVGVFSTSNGGATWSSLVSGLPRAVVTALKLHRPSRTLRAGTFGRGMWHLQAPLPGRSLPGLNDGGAVNGASFVRGAALAPGSIASVFGSNLASSNAAADKVPLPTSLAGASLQFNNALPIPAFFVSPGQANVQIPWELTGQTQASLAPTVAGSTYNAVTIQLAPFAPGIFSTNQQGTGQGAIQIANTVLFAAPEGSIPGAQARPARKGEFLTIYCTGLGDVSNRPASGAAASGSSLSTTKATPTVTIGGVSTPVSFSGLSPGFVGLYQVNVQVPDGAAVGNAIPLEITIGAVKSNTVTIAVE